MSLVACILMVGCTGGNGALEQGHSQESFTSNAVSTSVNSSAFFRPLHSELDLKQGLRFGGDDYLDLKTLGFVHYYRKPDGSWERVLSDYSTSFDISCAQGFQKNRFYVSGIARNGDTVLESWQVVPVLSVQTGAPDYSAAPQMLRTEVYRGSAVGGVTHLGPDPDDRFVLMLHSTTSSPSGPVTVDQLSRVDTVTGAVSVVLTAATVPELEGADGLYPMQHASEGRLWFIDAERVYPKVVLYDHDNDGSFDANTIIQDETTSIGMGYEGSVWTNDFVRSWYW